MSDTDKTLAIVMVAIILLSLFPVAGYLAIVVLLSHIIRRYKFNILFKVIKNDPALLLLLSSFGLSALFSSHHLANLPAFIVFAMQVCLYVIIRSQIRERAHNLSLIKYMLICGLFVSVIGILQYYFASHMVPGWIDLKLYNNIPNRAFSTLYNPNVLGSYLIVIISVAIAGFLCSDKKYGRLLSSAIIIISFLCMMLTFSRGAWLGLAVSIAIIFILSKERPYILSMIGLTVILAIPEFPKILSRINLDFLSNDSSNIYRRYLWQLAHQTFTENPILGTGLGTFGFSLPSHTKAAGYLVSHAHNLYLQILAETGLLGTITFFGYILLSMYVAFRLFRQSTCKQTKAMALGIAASCVGLLVHGTVDATLYLPQLSIFIWISMAAVRNLGDLEKVHVPVIAKYSLPIKPAFSRIVLTIKPLFTRLFFN